MKRALSLALLLVMLGGVASAQLIGITKGVKGGINLATIGGSDVPTGVTGITQYAAGVFVEISLPGPLAIQPEVLYSVKGSKADVPATFLTPAMTVTSTLSYIEIPVLLKFYLPTPVIKPNIFAGPALGILTSAKAKAEYSGGSVETDIKDAVTSSDIGAVIGAGVKLALPIVDLSIEGRYNYGLKSIDKQDGTKVYNRTISVLVGIGF